MQKLYAALSSIAVALSLSTITSAATEYVLVNLNSVTENAGKIYALNTATGALTLEGTLSTGGTGLKAINFGDVEQAITPNADCVFIADTGTSEIAAFSKTTTYSKVGNYTNVSVAFDEDGGSLSVTPNGKFLYATYSQSQNIGAWAINPDCSLAFVASYYPSALDLPLSALKVTPNGEYLVLGTTDQFAIDQSTGALTALGRLPECGCLFNGIDFTKDSKIVAFASGPAANAYVARITPTGLKDLRMWVLASPQQAAQNTIPFFSAAGYGGAGNLYFGAIGGGSEKTPSAVITTNFTESPLTLSVVSITQIDSPQFRDGAIAATGDIMVVAEFPNQIGVYQINPDGSLTQLSTTTVTGNEIGLFSLSIFPNTR
jgi:hypothetical protein